MTNTMFDLSGKVALVTGGAKGIGEAISRQLAALGAHVIIADMDTESALQTRQKIQQQGQLASNYALDVASEESINRVCQQVIAEVGTPWILVNNAGLQDRQSFLESTALEWDRMNRVNARGPFLLTREIAKAMIAAGNGGRIINVASMVLRGGIVNGLVAYGSSKGALVGLSHTTAYELAEYGITVNTVLPGGVATPGAIAAKGPAAVGPGGRAAPLGRCEPDDIASAVVYFATPMARRVTDQILAVDAGFSIA